MSATSWGDSIRLSVTTALSRLLGFIPTLIGALIIIVIGWIIAGIIAKIVTAVLRKLPLQRAADSIGVTGFMQRSGVNQDLAGIIGAIIKWYIRLIALEAAFDALGIPQVAQLFNTIVLFLPNLIVALIIVFVGLLIGRFVSNIVRGMVSGSGVGNPGCVRQYHVLRDCGLRGLHGADPDQHRAVAAQHSLYRTGRCAHDRARPRLWPGRTGNGGTDAGRLDGRYAQPHPVVPTPRGAACAAAHDNG